MSQGIAVRHTDPGQDKSTLERIATDVSVILTTNEEILYIALQNAMSLSIRKDAAVVTSNRVILYRPALLGRFDFSDYLWQHVQNVHLKQGMLASDFTVQTVDKRRETLGALDKEQARRLYSIAQQYEQEWHEKRRIRQMEEDRAKAGGVYMAPSGPMGPATPGTAPDDPVARLAKVKSMLDQGLISEVEYETVKAKILASM